MESVYEWFNPGVLMGAATTVAAWTFYRTMRPRPFKVPVDLNKQSIVLDDGTRMSPYCTDGKLAEYLYDDGKTLYEGFRRGMLVSDNGRCLGERTGPDQSYEWLTYQQVFNRAQAFGSGLIVDGMQPQKETFLGIYSGNRNEWVIAEQACNMFSLVTVPLYDTLGIEACSFIINQTCMSHVVCDKAEKAQHLLDRAGEITSLKCIILMSEVPSSILQTALKHNISVVRFNDVEAKGKSNLQDPVPPRPSDLATVSYTSGTTGTPKGVMLTHGNIIACLAGTISIVLKSIKLGPDDCHLSYLPLAHMYERCVQASQFQHGGRVGFFGGDIRKLSSDMQALKPTSFFTVPRLLNQVYDKVMSDVKTSKVKSFLFNWALAAKEKELKQFIIRNDGFWDTLIFKKIRNRFGGEIRILFTGSAPIDQSVLTFARCVFGCHMFEGYGQTEATAGVTLTAPGEFVGGHVGGPVSNSLIKLVDVPEMGYFASSDKGEICCKGPMVMRGYYKDAAKTAETLEPDGWLHTGDIGQWEPNGTLKVIDRKKHIFKLAQGEYVAPEKIEAVGERSEYVTQVFVDGDGLKSYLVAVVVPDMDVLISWAKAHNLSTDVKDLCKSENIKDLILKSIQAKGFDAGLKGFEQVKKIYLHDDMFSLENDLLTPTLKKKRESLRKLFKPQINALYNKSA